MSISDVIARLNHQESRVHQLETNEALPIVARYTTTTGSLSSGVLTRLDYGTQGFDPWAAVTTGASWVFTVPIGGYYLVRASLLLDASTAFATGEIAYMGVYTGAGLYSYLFYDNRINAGGVTLYVQLRGSDIVKAAKDDTLYIQAYQNSGSSLTINSGAEYNYVSIARLG